jgi:hypothetical protein
MKILPSQMFVELALWRLVTTIPVPGTSTVGAVHEVLHAEDIIDLAYAKAPQCEEPQCACAVVLQVATVASAATTDPQEPTATRHFAVEVVFTCRNPVLGSHGVVVLIPSHLLPNPILRERHGGDEL